MKTLQVERQAKPRVGSRSISLMYYTKKYQESLSQLRKGDLWVIIVMGEALGAESEREQSIALLREGKYHELFSRIENSPVDHLIRTEILMAAAAHIEREQFEREILEALIEGCKNIYKLTLMLIKEGEKSWKTKAIEAAQGAGIEKKQYEREIAEALT